MFNATNSNDIISKSKKIFWIFFWISGIYIKFGILSKKSWTPEVIFLRNYWLGKAELLKCPKSPVSEHLWTVKILKGLKHCLHLHRSIFVIFFDNSERKSAPKTIFLKYLKSWDCFQNIDTRWEVFSLSKSECLTQPIQMQLSNNQKKCSEFFSSFPESA